MIGFDINKIHPVRLPLADCISLGESIGQGTQPPPPPDQTFHDPPKKAQTGETMLKQYDDTRKEEPAPDNGPIPKEIADAVIDLTTLEALSAIEIRQALRDRKSIEVEKAPLRDILERMMKDNVLVWYREGEKYKVM